jgi:hypothetical protein
MLFDLQGPRKTLVKVIYLGLAILMGGGLVLFGVGSQVNGGLANVFGNSSSSDAAQTTVENAQKAVAKNPNDPKALQNLIAANYGLSVTAENYNSKTQEFSKAGKAQLQQGAKNWNKYLKETDGKPSLQTANYAVQLYLGLQDAKGAAKAQALVTAQKPNSANYLALMLYALYAGDQVTASGAEVRAKELATKDTIDEVNQQIKSTKKQIGERNAGIQKQIQQQFAQQQQSGQSAAGNPFGGSAGAGSGGTTPSN